MTPSTQLFLAALFWFLLHAVVAGSGLRGMLVQRLGENGFRGLFSVLSLLSLVLLVLAFRGAPCEPLWVVPRFCSWLPIVVMPLAYFLLLGSFVVKNPTAVGGDSVLDSEQPARGVLRITRHPFLWAVILWSVVHILANGDLGGSLFFGSMLLTALVGTRDIDRKRARSNPLAWQRYAELTSNPPGFALLSGRNRLVWRELALPAAGAALLTLATLYLHPLIFRVSPLP